MEAKGDTIQHKLELFHRACREHGLHITPQRTAIYKELIASNEHPSAVAIYQKVREYYANISLDTVNRTLLTFQKIGLAKVLESSGDPKRFDPNLDSHHHFRCVICGQIIDFKNEPYDKLEIPEHIAKKHVVMDKRVHLDGVCDRCQVDR